MEKENNLNKQYFEIINNCKNTFKDKLKDYGVSWRVFRNNAIADQIFIKIKRIRQIEETEINNVGDNIIEDYGAIVNYSIIGLIQLNLNSVTKPDISIDDAIKLYDIKVNTSWELLERKNADYGEAWRDMHIESFTDLMLTKLLRIKEILKNGEVKVSEGIDSNYQDIMNYAIFALIKLLKL